MSWPTCRSPVSIRCAPNHITPTVEMFMMNVTNGNREAIRRPTVVVVSTRSALARSKRRLSWDSRTKARTTRMPVICSRRTRFSVSILVCMAWNSGPIFVTRTPMPAPSTMTATRMIQERPTSSRSAMNTPPTIVMGAETSMTQVIRTSIWTCCTSLVLRVIRLGAPNLFISLLENDSALSKMAVRTSRPNCIAVFAPAHTAPIWAAAWTTDSSSMTAPVRQM